jgi:arabinogalactan endo-1,4-beta-galactosidase
MVDNGLPTTAWDVFGFSFYLFYGTAATFENLRTTLNSLAEEYRKPLRWWEQTTLQSVTADTIQFLHLPNQRFHTM